MNGRPNHRVLFSEPEIRARVEALAVAISRIPDRPEYAFPILVGAFVFAADLLRALDSCGVSLPVEFLHLRSYGALRAPEGEVRVLAGPSCAVRGQHALLVDGVLDKGHTIAKARELVFQAGARKVTTAVVIDKRRADALLAADFAGFAGVPEFVVGYGMDDAGRFRSLPYIAAALPNPGEPSPAR